MKRPMALFAFIAFVLMLLCFYERKLSMISLILSLLIIPIAVIFDKYKYVLPAVLLFAVMLNMISTYSKIDKVNLLSKSVITEDFVATEDSEPGKDEINFAEFKCLSGDNIPKNYNISLIFYGDKTVKAGDVYNLSVKIREPDSQRKQSYYGESVYFSGYIKSFNYEKQEDIFYRALGSIRRYIVRSDFEYLKGDTAAVLVAVTVGDKSYLSDKLSKDIKTVGVSHMMAVSGLHLAILIGSLFSLINRFLRNKYLRFFLSLFLVLFISAVCGFSKSIVRAGLMYVIAAAAPLLGRESDALNTLGTAVLFILAVSPFAALSIALKLSVLATLAIVYISPFFKDKFFENTGISFKPFKEAFSLIFDTVFATVFTLPVLVRYFGEVSLVSVFANLFLNLIVTAALVLNALALIFPHFLMPVRHVLFKTAGFFSFLMKKLISGFAEFPFASVKLGESAFAVSVIIVVLIVLSVDFLRFYQKYKRREAL